SLSIGLVAALGTGAVLLVGGRLALKHALTVGALVVFLSYLRNLQGKITSLAQAYTKLQALAGPVQRVLEVLESEPDLPQAAPTRSQRRLPSGGRDLQDVRTHVQMEAVAFGYDPQRSVLQDISLDVPAGETVAIVGESGAGKTTLVSLIPRFFDPDSGRV